MGVEPLPNTRDGIVVERLVKTLGHVSDMRSCEHIVLRSEGVRRRQRLNVEHVDRRAGYLLVLQYVDQSCSSTMGPRDALISRAVGFILCSSVRLQSPKQFC